MTLTEQDYRLLRHLYWQPEPLACLSIYGPKKHLRTRLQSLKRSGLVSFARLPLSPHDYGDPKRWRLTKAGAELLESSRIPGLPSSRRSRPR